MEEPKRYEPLPMFAAPRRVSSDEERTALVAMLEHFGDKREVWVTPYLRKLYEALPQLADYERRALINDLLDDGIVSVVKRQGHPHDYSVMVINWNHPDVREMYPE